ncbi:hypothetical protein ACOJQI_20915 [Bacillus salacetis]|uniref:hypothetical protein n=1 Tax=Bacillus salacetis TaxID=2315464 RepID=UPI003BA1E63E
MDKRNVKALSELFRDTRIYSQNRYSKNSPLRIFQKEYPNHTYSKEVDEFISTQSLEAFGDGADLPWWGDKYFSDIKAPRVMILTQDSLGPNKGSVVAYMPFLIDESKSSSDLNEYVRRYDWQKFGAFTRFRNLFKKLELDNRFLYVTDARKVSGDWKRVLEKEIEIVSPDVILCLGQTGLEYLSDIKSGVTKLVDRKDTIVEITTGRLPQMIKKPVVVASLFPSGSNGHYTHEREDNSANTFNMVIERLNRDGLTPSVLQH